ncbi:serine--tRNA ligase [Ureaplasma miroungigenitalium]|uniref:serine--tRNA ligase n=1 Tax=Ureaplasma miroungigenitalium TaxID=1042321 RepID=UPI0021E7D8B0|nr:serine--tRNA ligase [Ureaplasma miroungigenitalium]MCV3734379.1 serine--tRNA ligase [Ureaplasma miroungigenitalium]
MLDINLIRTNNQYVKDKLQHRNFNVEIIDQILELDEQIRNLILRSEKLQAKKNQDSKLVGSLVKTDPIKHQALIKELSVCKEEIAALTDELNQLKTTFNDLMNTVPNLFDDSVPIGADENDNLEVKRWSTPRVFDFTPLAHWDLAVNNQLIDFNKATKITGSRFIIYTNKGAKLYRALQMFCLDHNIANGYTEIACPVIVNQQSLYATGQLPKFKEDLFALENSDYYLSPTAEVQLTNLLRNEIVMQSELPYYFTGLTACFRSEAGSAGKDVRGVIRQHQFMKVETVKIVEPQNSMQELEDLVKNAESILEALKLPYRRLLLCSGDMGFSSAKTYDLEVWLPSYNAYKEISSCSNCLDFQARRAKIRYKAKVEDQANYVHTLNGSALAIDRLWAAVVENYQTADGEIEIPEALKPYYI